MINLETLLKDSISSTYHRRVDEILQIIDKSVDYVYRFTRNLEQLKCLVKQSTKEGDDDVIDFDIKVYNGSAVYYPDIILNGDFIVIIKRIRVLGNNPRTINYLLVYEKDWRLYQC